MNLSSPVVASSSSPSQPLADQNYYSSNNFDLIRLIAATQVVISHVVADMHVTALSRFTAVIEYFPGVPAFFFISGFLIKAAWERNPDIRVFYMNRAYRILPALWASVTLAAVTLFIFFDHTTLIANAGKLAVWLVAQGTLGQVWNPDFLRGYGIGVVNGSLWTIPVELSFYALIPVLALVFARRFTPVQILPILAVAAFALNYGIVMWTPATPRQLLVQKLVTVSPFPWLGMFFMGMLAQEYIGRLYRFFAGRVWIYLLVFVVVSYLSALKPIYPFLSGPDQVLGGGNRIGAANYLALCALVLSAAYSYRTLSDRLLARNDVSYGIYIAHGIVINVFVQIGITGLAGFGLVLPVTLALAITSWRFLEKPVLARRKASLYQH